MKLEVKFYRGVGEMVTLTSTVVIHDSDAAEDAAAAFDSLGYNLCYGELPSGKFISGLNLEEMRDDLSTDYDIIEIGGTLLSNIRDGQNTMLDSAWI